jgi:outer membrane lipoprotein-sorting protein
MRFEKVVIVFALICLCTLCLGCGEKASTDDILSKVYTRANSFEDYSYTMYINSNLNGNNAEKYSIIWKKSMFMKGTFQTSNIEPGIEMMSNRSMQLIYNPESNIIFKKLLCNTSTDNKLFEPNLYSVFLNEALTGMSASLVGSDIIAGRDTYVLELNPSINNNETMGGKARIWVDKKNWMAIRYERLNKNEDILFTVRINNIRINDNVSENHFDFEMPKESTVVVLDEEQLSTELEKMQLEDSRKKVTFEVLTPAYIPKGYKLNYTTVSSSMDTQYSSFIYGGFSVFSGQPYERVTLVYANGDNELHIRETLSERKSSDVDCFENDVICIDINGSEGKMYPVFGGNMRTLEWQSGDITITIISSFNESEIKSIAESFS